MNYDDLLIYLEIEDGSEFRYFEAMADLVECDEYIEQEAMDAFLQRRIQPRYPDL